MIYERIKSLCEKNKISIYRVEKDLGFSASSIAKWKTAIPAADKLKMVADYFHLPMEYFLSDQKETAQRGGGKSGGKHDLDIQKEVKNNIKQII